jgi:Tol biopolymer transport system component
VGAVLLAVAGAAALALTRRPPEARLGRRVQLTLSPGIELDPALSPDGKLVAFVAGPLSATRLYVRQVDGGTPVAITPEGGSARAPQWSPDGQRLLFSSGRGIQMIPSLGGVPRLLVVAPPGTSWIDAAWSSDGQSIVYSLSDSVFTRPLNGGNSRGLARVAEAHSCSPSPNGQWIACVSGNRPFRQNEEFGNIANSSIWVFPAAGGSAVRVSDDESLNTSPAWLPHPMSLLYVSNREGGRDIYQVALTRSGRPAGDAVRLTTGLNAATVSVAADGRRLAYAAYTRTANVWSAPIPVTGTTRMSQAQPVTTGSQEIEAFDVSADGRWLLFDSDRSGSQQLYRMPLSGGDAEQLTNDPELAMGPAVSPDGREIAYHSFRNGVRQIFVMGPEGGAPVQVTHDSAQNRLATWSPDGRSLAFQKNAQAPSHENDVVSRDAAGNWGTPRTLLSGGDIPTWAPDGRGVLTLMNKGDRPALVIVPLAGGSLRTVIQPGGPSPVTGSVWAWSRDARFIYYIARDSAEKKTGIWRVPTRGGPARLALWFDDPSRLLRPWLKVHGNRFYFTLGDLQSHIWMTEMRGSS